MPDQPDPRRRLPENCLCRTCTFCFAFVTKTGPAMEFINVRCRIDHVNDHPLFVLSNVLNGEGSVEFDDTMVVECSHYDQESAGG